MNMSMGMGTDGYSDDDLNLDRASILLETEVSPIDNLGYLVRITIGDTHSFLLLDSKGNSTEINLCPTS